MSLTKLIIAIVLLSLGFVGGHYVASNKAIATQAIAVKKVEDAKKKVEDAKKKIDDEFTIAKLNWATERANLNSAAAAALTEAYKEADAREQVLRKAAKASEARYQSKLKELENARNQADTIAIDPAPNGGLWIDIETGSCPVTTGGALGGQSSYMPKAGGPTSGSSAYLRCRIAPEPAQSLIKIADTSDHRTELLNKCISQLGDQQTVLNPTKDTP